MEQQRLSFIPVEMQNGADTLEDSLVFSHELNIFVPYNPTIMLLGIYPKELKTYIHANPCTWIFIAALFRISKIEKQPRCSSGGEYINSMHADNEILFRAKKKGAIKL